MFNERVLAEIGITVDDINFINQIAIQAGEKAKYIYENKELHVETKSGPDDFVTFADKELSNDLLKALRERFPEDIIISEEEEPEKITDTSKKVWVIDPIDGTDYYINGYGWYSVMIGLLKDNQPVAGWVHAPVKHRLILGIPGDGVFELTKNAEMKKLAINLADKNHETPLKIMMGKRDRKINPQIKEKMSSFEFVEMGSLGLKVIHIIDNHADALIHACKQLSIWDTVPASAIAIASGQQISTMCGKEFTYSPETLKHDSTYAVGKAWAMNEVKNTLES